MQDRELMDRIRNYKTENGFTLNELSKMIDVQISTLERWLRTGRINKVFAKLVRDKLSL